MEHTGSAPLKRADRLTLVSGALAGVAGLLVFLALHALWILPIWFMLPAGLVFALAGGVAMGWAYAQLRPGLPQRPPAALVMLVVVSVTLLPAILLAQLRPTLFIETPRGALPTEPIPMLIVRFVAELLATATIAGGLITLRVSFAIGWWLRCSDRARPPRCRDRRLDVGAGGESQRTDREGQAQQHRPWDNRAPRNLAARARVALSRRAVRSTRNL